MPKYNGHIQYIDKRKLFEATDRPGECDTALPQTWCDAPNTACDLWDTNWDEVQAKMGAVWYYSPDNIWGDVLFVSDMLQELGIGIELEW